MTWLYLPSTSSRCAPVAMASTSDWTWQCRLLEVSAWWRGKPSRFRDWYRRCNKVSSLRPLFGAMPEPSTAAHGAALWMASLAASRVSRTVSPAGDAAPMTRATSGQRPGASSFNLAPGGASSKMSPACLPRRPASAPAPSACGETYSDWVLRLRADYSARLKLAESFGEIASSFWQSPTTRDEKGQSGRGNRIRRGKNGRLHVANLCDQIEDLGRPDLIRSVRFREILMGWPIYWCSIGRMPSACSATALSLWRRRMRSALSSLASPRAAPPAQLSWLA